MSEAREWNQEEDRLLKLIYETSGLSKWSHIARKLTEMGVKGRNGKQCKQRYVTHIDTSHPREDWPHNHQARLFELHNQLGNKWAIIGTQLGGRTDNAVKNHFYSRLRKALKRLNRVVSGLQRKDLKEVKPNVLYRIVEVVEEKFKEIPKFDRDFSISSNQLKNQLLEYSYEQMQQQDESEQMMASEVQKATQLWRLLSEFSGTYKKRTKKGGMAVEQDLLTPTRYQRAKRCNSENQESEGSSSAVQSSDTSNFQDPSDDQIRRTNSNRRRKNSADANSLLPLPRIRTRAYSQGNSRDQSDLSQQMKPEPIQQQRPQQGLLVQQLGDLHIFEEEDIPPHPLLMKKQTSKYSRYSENAIEKEQYHFFEDSEIEMRILPEMEIGTRKESQYEEKLFN